MKRGRFFKKRLNEYWVTLIIILTLIGGYYAYHKIIIKNVFEEMYNSYYNILSIKSIDNMPQIKPIPRDEKHLDSVDLNYKNNTEDVIINIFLVNRENKKEIILICSRLIASGVYLDINYDYDMKTHKLINDITFHGENAPNVDDGKKQTRELLEKHNISKEYLQKKSGELLDTVLTDWQKYSGSSYSRSNMGRLTIEKDEFLG
nr:TipC family immunity protein [Gemella morbillorum]